VWEAWENPEYGKEVQSCTLIATESNALMAPIHDRTPVILDPLIYDRWLDADEATNDLLSLLKPFPPDELAAYPVSTSSTTPAIKGRNASNQRDPTNN
jgi:putative SOS response-associated peptidase YedK